MVFHHQFLIATDRREWTSHFARQDFHFENLWFVPAASEQACMALDQSQLRAQSRSAIFLLHLAARNAFQMEYKKAMIKRRADRVGVYCALLGGGLPPVFADRLAESEIQSLADTYRKHWPPKESFRESSGIAGAQLGIALETRGPLNTFNHPAFACLHALERAALDLKRNIIDLAVLGSALALDDPFEAIDPNASAQELRECAVLLLLDADGARTLLDAMSVKTLARSVFGIAGPLLEILLEGKIK